jgi:hypothetical protein
MHDKEYVTQEHHQAIAKAEQYNHLVEIAFDILNRIPKPVEQVCGPFSTGGLGSVEKNMTQVQKAIAKLTSKGHNIFNWVIFEKQLGLIRKNSQKKTIPEINQELLDEFYNPLHESGIIEVMYFIPGWESSHGASWERKQAKRLGIKIVDLPEDFLDE